MENFYIASVCLTENIGCMRAKVLLDHFGSGKAIWQASREELEATELKSYLIDELLNFRNLHPDCPERLQEYCEKKKIKLCSIKDFDYPEKLKDMKNPPIVFYYRGTIKSKDARIAMVGTRKPTEYGLKIANQLSVELASQGITIVSGAAIGIDTMCHRGALKVGSRTVAILGEGLEAVYSSDKRNFLEEIAENGAVISEYSPNAHCKKGMFPQRNRIIAGLSVGVVVVEAGESSGAMNTAQHAGDNGRLIFAVPGNIYSEKSAGCHELIRDGAILIRSAKDILEDCKFNIGYDSLPIDETLFKDKPAEAKVIGLPPLEGDEEKVFKLILNSKSISAEEILMKLDDMDSAEVNNILLNLEMSGYIEQDSLENYVSIYGKY